MNPNVKICCFLLLLLWGYSCRAPAEEDNDATFLSHFPKLELPDTLELGPERKGKLLPATYLYGVLDSTEIIELYPYWDDTDSIQALGRFSLYQYEAVWLEMRHNWQYMGLLIWFEKDQQGIKAVLPTHFLDGGEGGQILQASWLLDWDQDGDLDWVRREYGHFLTPTVDSFEEKTYDSIYVKLWDGQTFQPSQVEQDSSYRLQFPIEW